MNESSSYKSTCSSDRGNIYTFVLINGQTLGAVSVAWLRPAEIRPPWGTLGIDARGAQSFAKAAFSKETTVSA